MSKNNQKLDDRLKGVLREDDKTEETKPKEDKQEKKETKKQDDLNELVKKQQEQIEELREMIRSVSPSYKVDAFEEAKKDKSAKIVSVSIYKGKPVVAWSDLITNTVKLQHKDQHIWDQTTELTYLDGEKEVVDYQIWQRDKKMAKGIVKSETTTKEKGIEKKTLTVSLKDFDDFEIEERFIN